MVRITLDQYELKALSNQSRTVLRQTLEVLDENSEDITYRSYDLLFARHPQLRSAFADERADHPQVFLTALQTCVRVSACDSKLSESEFRQIAVANRIFDLERPLHPLFHDYVLEAIEDILFDDATEEMLDVWSRVIDCMFDYLGVLQRMTVNTWESKVN